MLNRAYLTVQFPYIDMMHVALMHEKSEHVLIYYIWTMLTCVGQSQKS